MGKKLASDRAEAARRLTPRRLLVAVAAAAAALVAVPFSGSASAHPVVFEIGRCVKLKTATGGYTNKGCTAASEAKVGKFEWQPGLAKNTYTLTAAGGSVSTGYLPVRRGRLRRAVRPGHGLADRNIRGSRHRDVELL